MAADPDKIEEEHENEKQADNGAGMRLSRGIPQEASEEAADEAGARLPGLGGSEWMGHGKASLEAGCGEDSDLGGVEEASRFSFCL